MTQSVEVRQIRVEYKTASGPMIAVRDVSFKLAPSEFLCILGPSGCGKTTIMNCIAGFIVPSAGEILIGGKSVTARGYDRGVVLQDLTQLFPWRTARGNVEFGLQVRKLPAAERRARAEEMLGLVELQEFADSYPHELSGGMQQRVAIARALAYDPAVLLMDEPFAALDAMTRDTMQRQLTEIWSATQKTVIYITHNVSEAVYLGDRIMIMSKDGTVKTNLHNKLSRPRDPLGEKFIEMQREVLGQLTH